MATIGRAGLKSSQFWFREPSEKASHDITRKNKKRRSWEFWRWNLFGTNYQNSGHRARSGFNRSLVLFQLFHSPQLLCSIECCCSVLGTRCVSTSRPYSVSVVAVTSNCRHHYCCFYWNYCYCCGGCILPNSLTPETKQGIPSADWKKMYKSKYSWFICCVLIFIVNNNIHRPVWDGCRDLNQLDTALSKGWLQNKLPLFRQTACWSVFQTSHL